jgi:exosortase A-associated hydrolase 1
MSMARSRESPVLFSCEEDRLFGVLHGSSGETAVVLIVGGPQYRAGSHRFFGQVARALAADGYPVLRFDARGMGDSTGDSRGFEQITADIGSAIDVLVERQPQVNRVVLWGLCDGASAALLYLHDRRDTRITSLCLLNPWVRSARTLARTHVRHYYLRRVRERAFWTKLIAGGIATHALNDLARSVSLAIRGGVTGSKASQTFQHRMRLAWESFSGPTLLVLSEDDYTAKEFDQYTRDEPGWRTPTTGDAMLTRSVVPGADHTFSDSSSKLQFLNVLLKWLDATRPSVQGLRQGEPNASQRARTRLPAA